jgi:flagellar biosynthetic protein FliO
MPTPPADLPSLAPAPLTDLPSLGSSIAVSFLSLGIVCLVAFVALRWLGRRGQPSNIGALRVLARQSLDQKRSLFVIEAAQRCFLVGAGEGAMTLLAELDKAAVQRDLALAAPQPGSMSRRFADVLVKVLGKPAPSIARSAMTAESQREEADHAAGT